MREPSKRRRESKNPVRNPPPPKKKKEERNPMRGHFLAIENASPHSAAAFLGRFAPATTCRSIRLRFCSFFSFFFFTLPNVFYISFVSGFSIGPRPLVRGEIPSFRFFLLLLSLFLSRHHFRIFSKPTLAAGFHRAMVSFLFFLNFNEFSPPPLPSNGHQVGHANIMKISRFFSFFFTSHFTQFRYLTRRRRNRPRRRRRRRRRRRKRWARPRFFDFSFAMTQMRPQPGRNSVKLAKSIVFCFVCLCRPLNNNNNQKKIEPSRRGGSKFREIQINRVWFQCPIHTQKKAKEAR